MTRDETIQKIVDHFVLRGEDGAYTERGLRTPSPIWASLMLLEALGLVKFDDAPSP